VGSQDVVPIEGVEDRPPGGDPLYEPVSRQFVEGVLDALLAGISPQQPHNVPARQWIGGVDQHLEDLAR
jgi:hypothetical protein